MIFLFILFIFFLAKQEDVKEIINAGFEKLFHVENGVAAPYVCLICDRFTGPNWSLIGVKALEKKDYFKVDDSILKLDDNLEKPYKYVGKGRATWMDQCLLSKRGMCIKKNRHNNFVVCSECDSCLKSNKRPAKGIAHGFF